MTFFTSFLVSTCNYSGSVLAAHLPRLCNNNRGKTGLGREGFRFITLEDEFGFINVIVRPQVYETYRRVIRSEQLLLVYGQVKRERTVVNLIATRIAALA